jgi:hypothetical protein
VIGAVGKPLPTLFGAALSLLVSASLGHLTLVLGDVRAVRVGTGRLEAFCHFLFLGGGTTIGHMGVLGL